MRVTYYTFPEEVSPADCIDAYLKAKGWAPDMTAAICKKRNPPLCGGTTTARR